MKSPRSKTVELQYQTFKKEKEQRGEDLTVFNLAEEIVVREFAHWLIIENRFPYDHMTSINHMLIPKRPFTSFHQATKKEKSEHEQILKQLSDEMYYDAVVENFPRSKSVTRYAHAHLVRWKYTKDNGSNKSNK